MIVQGFSDQRGRALGYVLCFLALSMLNAAAMAQAPIREVYAGAFLEGATAFDITSKNTGAEYVVKIALPASYAESTGNYPLLIVLDGSMLFGTAAETAALQAATGEAHPIIIAAVSTKGSLQAHNLRRLRDYIPSGGSTSNETEQDNPVRAMLKKRFDAAGIPYDQALGGAPQFLAFLTTELLPVLERDYRVDQQQLGIFGHSAGGAFVSYVLLQKTSPFSKAIIGTFGITWYGEDLPRQEQEFAHAQATHKIDVFYGYGGLEVRDFGAQTIDDSIALLHRLQSSDPAYIDHMLIWNFEREQHGSVAASVISSGIHDLWGTGVRYGEAAKARE